MDKKLFSVGHYKNISGRAKIDIYFSGEPQAHIVIEYNGSNNVSIKRRDENVTYNYGVECPGYDIKKFVLRELFSNQATRDMDIISEVTKHINKVFLNMEE